MLSDNTNGKSLNAAGPIRYVISSETYNPAHLISWPHENASDTMPTAHVSNLASMIRPLVRERLESIEQDIPRSPELKDFLAEHLHTINVHLPTDRKLLMFHGWAEDKLKIAFRNLFFGHPGGWLEVFALVANFDSCNKEREAASKLIRLVKKQSKARNGRVIEINKKLLPLFKAWLNGVN